MVEIEEHCPVDFLLRTELLPSIWCSGCGIGIVVNVFTQVVGKADVHPDGVCVLSTGIGCTGKVSDYLKIRSYDVTDGSVVDCAIKLTSENPDVKVVLFLDDADFIASGVETFIQAGVKRAELLIIYFNNYIYRIFMEHRAPKKRPGNGVSSRKRFESPFNIPNLAKLCGALYIARWTPLHPRRLMNSITDALRQPGLSVIEVISPCLMYYPNIGRIGETIDRMGIYRDSSVIRNNEPTENLDIRSQQKIIVGEFGCSTI